MSQNRNTKRSKARKSGIEADKQNAAGFYKGMDGVFLDKEGNRRIYEISLSPDGTINVKLGCHPIQASHIIAQLMTDHPMTRQFVFIAVEKYKAERTKMSRFKAFFVSIWQFISGTKHKAPKGDDKIVDPTTLKGEKPATEPLKKV